MCCQMKLSAFDKSFANSVDRRVGSKKSCVIEVDAALDICICHDVSAVTVEYFVKESARGIAESEMELG